jgi:Carboxypeptidase regulatory-like domain/TonB-dependent Receptor Plug Domain
MRNFSVRGRKLPAFVLMACTIPAVAQVHGSISGRIEDPSGSPVTDATVTVESLETGARRVVKTGADGEFLATALPLGPQEVKVEKTGFKEAVRTGIRLEVGQDAVVNVQLEVGDLEQRVTVSADASMVNTTTSPVSGMVHEREVKELPLNGRSFDNLIALNPGAINYELKSANTSTSNGNTFVIAGRRPGDTLFLLNGVEYMGSSQLAVTPGGASQELLGIDAIREFNVLTDTYPAEYGKRAGGQVVVVTQSGTNSLHGSLFEFLRNSALDARNFFDRESVPPFRRNQFGGALGGPVKKKRMFLFGNYEGFRQELAVSNVSVVPDQATRHSPSANPAIVPYFAMWPQPNGQELGGGIALSYNNPRQSIREDFGTARADHVLGNRDTLSESYTIDDGTNLSPQADPLFGAFLTLRNQVVSVQEVHTFSPSVVNVFTAGYSRAAFNFDPYNYVPFPANLAFVTGGGPGGIVIGGGATTTSGSTVITSAGPNNAANVWNRRNLFTETDDLRISKGIHQISAGVWLQRLRDNEDTASRQLGQATFTSLATFLAGTVSTFQVVPNPNELGWRSFYGAWYLQDVMKLRPNLTLSVGLRYEASTGWNEVSGRAANYIPDSTGVLQTNPLVGSSAFTQNNATHLLGPRIGLAYDPYGNGKMAIRAGFGTYYSLIDALSFLMNSLPPWNGAVSYSNTALTSVLPVTPGVQPAPSCGPGIPQPCTIFAPQGVQANAQTPTVQEWNFTVEREVYHDMSLRVAYVGSHGYHGLLSIDPNSIPAQVCGSAVGCTAGGTPGTTKSTVPQGAQYIPVASRPNPYLGAGFFWYTEGNSSYNALQIDAKKRLSHGLQFRANYTWSRGLDMNSGLTGAQSNNQAQMILDRNDVARDWGPSALNAAHQGSISASYSMPFFHANKFLGGWQVNAIVTLLSGFPFTPQVGSNRSGDGDTRNPDRPSLNPAFSGPVILGSPTGWFNPNAFTLPAAGTYGNLGRGTYSGPGLADLDTSLFKTFPVTERVSLQFRAEFFNALNRVNFGTPNATVYSGTTYSPSAGLITSTATTSRQIQFGLKLIF